jgi:hypothetical protein
MLAASLGLAVVLAHAIAGSVQAGPTVACPDGPDPLRFRPEISLATTSSDAEPLALDASVDPASGREWVAIAFLTPAGAVSVAVSGDGGCTFAAASGGMPPTIVSAGPVITARPAVALRVVGTPLLAVAWREGDAILVRTTATLNGTFGAAATLEANARSGPRLALAPGLGGPSLAAAWIADDVGSRVVRASITANPIDPLAWPAAATLNGTLGPDLGNLAEVALAADAAGNAGGPGFTLLATVDSTGAAHASRANDPAAGFGAWRRIDDGLLMRSAAPSLAGAAMALPAGGTAWTATAWSGLRRSGPATERVVADSALTDNGATTSDFEGAVGAPNPIEASPVNAGARTAVAVAGDAPGVTAFALWDNTGEIRAGRRPLAPGRPHLAGGCGPFQVSGLSPVRAGGRAWAPVADALGNDVALAFVDDRTGSPEIWFKRSDSTAPGAGLTLTPAACGPPPRIQVDWTPAPCDIAQVDVEVGTSPGGTDFVRNGTGLSGILVEGLQPGVLYYVRVRFTDLAGNVGVTAEASATTAACVPAHLRTTVLSITDSCAAGGPGNGDGRVDPGESGRYMLRVTNVGTADSIGATIRGQARSPYLTVRTSVALVPDLVPGATFDTPLVVDLSATAPCGLPFEVLLRTDIPGAAWSDLVALPGGPPCTTCRTAGCSTTADGSATTPTATCAGGRITLDAGASRATNCGGTLIYEWWEGTTLLSTSAAFLVTPAGSTSYRLVTRCSTDFACMAETAVPITIHPLPGITFSETPPAPHCAGDLVTLRAQTSDPGATYTWSDGVSGATHDVTSSGVLSCTVLDTNGCSSTRSIRYEFGEIPTADAGADIVACGAVVIGAPGFPLLDYRWDPPDGLSSRWVAQPRASPSVPTIYTLTVTDPTTGCSATDSVLVDTRPGPGPLQDLRVTRQGADLAFAWTDPLDALTTRVYSDPAARTAASANASSTTARLECEGLSGCLAPPGTEPLLFYQAVSVCLDGVNEGPN